VALHGQFDLFLSTGHEIQLGIEGVKFEEVATGFPGWRAGSAVTDFSRVLRPWREPSFVRLRIVDGELLSAGLVMPSAAASLEVSSASQYDLSDVDYQNRRCSNKIASSRKNMTLSGPFGSAVFSERNRALHCVALHLAGEDVVEHRALDRVPAGQLHLISLNLPLQVSAESFTLVNSMKRACGLLDKEPVLSRSPRVVDLNLPDAGGRLWIAGRNHGVRKLRRLGKRAKESFRRNLIVIGHHHVRHDGDVAGHLIWPVARAAGNDDAGTALEQCANDLSAGDVQRRAIPFDLQPRCVVRKIFWLKDLRSNTGNFRDAIADVSQPGLPNLPLRLVIALRPHLDGGEHSHNFFLADLERATEGMVRRTVQPGSLQEIFLPKQHARTLRTAHAFAAAVRHHGRPAREVMIGERRSLCRRIN
jgi:hypothetical protein